MPACRETHAHVGEAGWTQGCLPVNLYGGPFLCRQTRGVDPVVTPPSRRGQDGLPPLDPGHHALSNPGHGGAMDPAAAGGLQRLRSGGFGSPPRQVSPPVRGLTAV